LGNRGANWASLNTVPSASRKRRYGLPRGKAARATVAVDAGTSGQVWGRRDIASLQDQALALMRSILNAQPSPRDLKQFASSIQGVEGSVKNLSTPGGWNGTETSAEAVHPRV